MSDEGSDDLVWMKEYEEFCKSEEDEDYDDDEEEDAED